jgi:hypothetical protein
MRRTTLRIAVCGRLHGAEADAVAAALLQIPAEADVRWIAGPPADWPQVAGEADLCIALQGWPDEIPARDADALVAACAAGRLICCQGTWCASAGRTRVIWPPALCVPVEQFASRLAFELSVLAGERPPLPATASRDEAFAAHYALFSNTACATAVVDSPDPIYRRELQRALSSTEPAEGRECNIIDADCASGNAAQRGDAACVLVTGFPRPDEFSVPRAAETRVIVSKLAPQSDLRAAVQRATDIVRSET